MIKKKIFVLILCVTFILPFGVLGCSNSNTTNQDPKSEVEHIADNASNAVKNGVDMVGEGAKELGEKGMDLVNKVTDTGMEYTEDNFKEDMTKRGIVLEETEEAKSLFSVENDDYLVNGERISVYEYNKESKSNLESDLRTVADNGMTINSTNVKWSNTPHMYKKGRLIVIYDSNNATVLQNLKEVLGVPLLG